MVEIDKNKIVYFFGGLIIYFLIGAYLKMVVPTWLINIYYVAPLALMIYAGYIFTMRSLHKK